MSHFVNAQNVFSKFTDTLVTDDFRTNKFNFPQKYTAFEISIIENGQYRVKRLSDQGKSISYLKTDKPLYACQVTAEIEIPKGSKNGGGLVLYGQSTSDGAIFLEVKEKKQYKIYKQSGTQLRLLSGSAKTQGWAKAKSMNSSGKNTITVKMENGYIDIFFNNVFTYTVFDTEFNNGKVGIYAAQNSEIVLTKFIVLKKKDPLLGVQLNNNTGQPNNGTSQNNDNADPAFQEVILIFKTKIDQQQVTIANLQSELDKCKSVLNYDTNLVSRSQELETQNRILSYKLDSTTKVLRQDKKRLEYLESVKEDIEKGSNGDLVLSLTAILADIKKENQILKDRSVAAEEANKTAKKDNEILLREVKRLKSMLNIEE